MIVSNRTHLFSSIFVFSALALGASACGTAKTPGGNNTLWDLSFTQPADTSSLTVLADPHLGYWEQTTNKDIMQRLHVYSDSKTASTRMILSIKCVKSGEIIKANSKTARIHLDKTRKVVVFDEATTVKASLPRTLESCSLSIAQNTELEYSFDSNGDLSLKFPISGYGEVHYKRLGDPDNK